MNESTSWPPNHLVSQLGSCIFFIWSVNPKSSFSCVGFISSWFWKDGQQQQRSGVVDCSFLGGPDLPGSFQNQFSRWYAIFHSLFKLIVLYVFVLEQNKILAKEFRTQRWRWNGRVSRIIIFIFDFYVYHVFPFIAFNSIINYQSSFKIILRSKFLFYLLIFNIFFVLSLAAWNLGVYNFYSLHNI